MVRERQGPWRLPHFPSRKLPQCLPRLLFISKRPKLFGLSVGDSQGNGKSQKVGWRSRAQTRTRIHQIRKAPTLVKTTLYIKALFLTLGLMTTATTWGATAAFTGKVTAVKKAEAKKKDTLVHFTVEIDYFDYLSRGGGRLSKVGHTSDQRVLKLGSVCVINGRMVNAATFAKAIRPDLWGYFYETTWLDLQTTPNFQWGEVIAIAKDAFTLRVHRTHKEIHLEANPPVEIKVPL